MRSAIVATALCLLTLSVGANPPSYINYQGKITNAHGQPLAKGDYVLSLRIFDAPSAGTLVWGPQVFDGDTAQGHGSRVPVVDGHFNVILGQTDTSGRPVTDAFASAPRYLEITVGSNTPILPRHQVLSAPYAVNASVVRGQDVVANLATLQSTLSTRIDAAMTPPVASYRLTTHQTKQPHIPLRINFNQKLVDTHDAVTPDSSSWKFTARVTGLYQIHAWIHTDLVGIANKVSDNYIALKSSRAPATELIKTVSWDWSGSLSYIARLAAGESIWFEYTQSSHASALTDGHCSIVLLVRE